MQVLISFFNNNIFLLSAISTLITTIVSFKFLLPLFIRFKFLDQPTSRSNHKVAIPLGGGLVIIPLIIFNTFLFNYDWAIVNIIIIFLLFLVSLIDDLQNIKASVRLGMHLFCVTIYIYFNLINEIDSYLYLSKSYEKFIFCIFLILALSWFINAFNFMDGIDGITSIQVIFLTTSIIFLNYILGFNNSILHYALVGASIGFLIFNWSPASIFLGDSGSIPLGFFMTHFLLDFALKGFWVASLILPMYYILDTTITLIIRILNKEEFWKAHSQHFYQRFVRSGKTHSQVCIYVIILSLGLFLFALSSVIFKNNIIFLLLSFFWCVYFLYNFSINKKINTL